MRTTRRVASTFAVLLYAAALGGCGGSSGYNSSGITTFLPAPIAFPNSVQIGCQPGTLTGVISVRQTGYGGAFSAQSRNTAVALVAPGPGTAQFTVSRASNPGPGGSTQIYILGGGVQPAIVDVSVSAC
ncbi:MAG TPA: hypothetical protein VIG32_07540 [Candidatus Baltobacteraceae bacterium]|jgi:hypothetical protein